MSPCTWARSLPGCPSPQSIKEPNQQLGTPNTQEGLKTPVFGNHTALLLGKTHGIFSPRFGGASALLLRGRAEFHPVTNAELE